MQELKLHAISIATPDPSKKRGKIQEQNSDFFQNIIWTLTKSIISVFFANNLCPCYPTIFKTPGKRTLQNKDSANLSWSGAQQECQLAGIHVCCNGHGVEGIWMQMIFFFMCFFGGDGGGGGKRFLFWEDFFSCKKVLFKFEGFLKWEARVNESVECRWGDNSLLISLFCGVWEYQ